MACPRKMPKANIDWTRIPPDAKVDDCGNYYVVTTGKKRAVAFWGGRDARQAQTLLAAWARRGRR